MLRVKNLNKSFGKNLVLNDVNFEAQQGEILVIKGESGAGKTTLIRCICNLEEPDSGQIEIDQIQMLEKIGKKRNADIYQDKVGLVFQGYNLFPHLNIMDNLTVAVLSQKLMSKEQAEEKALQTLEKLGIRDKADQYPHQLSGGQKQRVAIGRSIMLNPSILCFDEPTSALDSKTTEGIAEIIRLLASDGICILIITHDNEFADKIATRQLHMVKSKLYENPEGIAIAK